MPPLTNQSTTMGSAYTGSGVAQYPNTPPDETPPPLDALLTEQVSGASYGYGNQFGHGNRFGAEGLNGLCTPVFDACAFAPGGTADNPLGFPGYHALYGRTFGTYWWMLQNPVIRLARSLATSDMLASQWLFEKAGDDVTDEQAKELSDLLARSFTPQLRYTVMEHCIRGRDFGRAPFEPVWDYAGGEYRLCDMVPLAIETAGVLRDRHGRFAGLSVALVPGVDYGLARFKIADNDQEVQGLAAPYKAWLYLYDDYARQLTGRSWLENVRETAWKDWLDAAQQLQKIGHLISGIRTAIIGPAGKIPGTDTSYSDSITTGMKALSSGAAGIYIPRATIPLDDRGNVDLLKLAVQYTKDQIQFNKIDLGNKGPEIASILDRMRHDEELMVMGSLRASRVGLEGQHGARSETQTKTNTATIVSEIENDDIARQLQPMVDAVLVLNKGEGFRGKMRCKCPPIEPRKAEVQLAIFQSCIASRDSAVSLEILRILDVDRYLKEQEFGVTDKFDVANVEATLATAKPGDLQGQPPTDGQQPQTADQAVNQIGGRMKGLLDKTAGRNGNGKANGQAVTK